jgi:hypothetical protein
MALTPFLAIANVISEMDPYPGIESASESLMVDRFEGTVAVLVTMADALESP